MMAGTKILEGTWDELASHEDELRRYPRLTLIIPLTSDLPTEENRAPLTAAQRIQLLDSLAARHRHLPGLPESAFDRENLYADEEAA
jgi:hypothetical protein